MIDYIIVLVLSLPAILVALTVHEYFHGYVAYRLGDPTAKYAGRLTFNPIKHIDILGLFAFIIFRFGWAKPVPINPYNFRNVNRGILYTSIAGPLSNFILAFILGLVLRVLPVGTQLFFPIVLMFQLGVIYNLIFCAFNLIPIPPLDGSNVLFSLLPPQYIHVEHTLKRYGFFILIGLFVVNQAGIPILWGWIGPFVNLFGQLFSGIPRLI